MMDLLTITQRIVRRLPISQVPSTVVDSTVPQIQQLLEILQEEGDELMSKNEWNVLISTFSFVVTDTQVSSETLPADWNRFLTEASVWRSGSLLTPLAGPCTSDAWHRLLTMPGIRFPGYWRLFNNELEVLGCPVDETASIEYISDKWVLSTETPDPLRYSTWQTDADTPLLPDRLYILGGVWRWKQSKGLEYAEDMRSYELQLERSISADRAARPISTRRYTNPDGPPYAWPGIITAPV